MNNIKNKFILFVIFLINLSAWTGFSIFGPLVPEIANGLFIGVGIIGVIHSICFIISGLMSFLWAFLESKYSRKSLIISALFLYSIGLLSSSFSFNYIIFFIFRIVMAVGFGALLPLSNSIIMDVKSSQHRTKALALLALTVMLGFGTSNIIAGTFLDLTSWRMILFILGLSKMIFITFIYVTDIPSPKIRGEMNPYYSFRLARPNLNQLGKIKSNLNFFILFFIHDFVVGTISFYIIPMLKTDLHLIPIYSMIVCIVMYIPQLIGAPYWGKVADHRFTRQSNGKISLLLLIVIIGPLFSIIGYSVFSFNIVIFIICIMIFAFITPTITSIAYSILGDINPPELRTTIFSLSNFSAICGRSMGIAACGILYEHIFHQYSIIFLFLQFIFLFGLTFTLIRPMLIIPIEMQNLISLLERRISGDEKTTSKTTPKPTIKDILNTLIESQIELFKKQEKLSQNQVYLTKFLKYTLEVSRRILLLPNKKELNLENHKYITQLKHRIEMIEEIEEASLK